MFLRPLNKKQKELFLELALKAAAANDVIEESEKALLAAYADEMGIEPISDNSLELDAILVGLKEISSVRELNQITFEIAGMMMSDLSYDDTEKEFMNNLASVWGISNEKINEMFECVNEYTDLIKKINVLLFD